MTRYWYECLSPQQACEAGTNPVGGDPAAVDALGRRLGRVADDLREHAALLRAVDASDFWRGDAAAAFARLQEKLPPKLELVATRYTAAGSALSSYAPDLAEARTAAARALQAYAQAAAERQVAQQDLARYQRGIADARRRHGTYTWSGQHPADRLDHADDAVAAAIRMMANAVDTRDAAAGTCATRIDDAADDDLKDDDSFWDALGDLGGHVLDALDAAAPVLRQVAGGLSIAAALLGWVPYVGPALAGASLIAHGAVLVVDLVRMAGGRDVTPGQVVADVIGVLPVGRLVRGAGLLGGVTGQVGDGIAAAGTLAAKGGVRTAAAATVRQLASPAGRAATGLRLVEDVGTKIGKDTLKVVAAHGPGGLTTNPTGWSIRGLPAGSGDNGTGGTGGTGPDTLALRRALTARVRRLGRDAAAAGCRLAALYDDVVAGTPLSASLLTTVLPAPPGLTPAALGALLVATRATAAAGGALPAVRAVELPTGPAARLRLADAVDGTPALEVQYALPAPDGRRIAVLTFATPATAYAEPFEQLFDAVAGTASWVG